MGAWVVVTAAGQGTRLGPDQPKALIEVDGNTVLELALERVLRSADLSGVVVTCPKGTELRFREVIDRVVANLSVGTNPQVRLVTGGASRQESVLAALEQVELAAAEHRSLPDANAPVLVHDAARCLTPTEVFDRLIAAIQSGEQAVIPVLPVSDTITEVDPATGLVQNNLDRSRLFAVQTPQAFTWSALSAAHDAARDRAGSESTAATDDATLVRELGIPVRVVPGSEASFKVTHPADLDRVRMWLGKTTA